MTSDPPPLASSEPISAHPGRWAAGPLGPGLARLYVLGAALLFSTGGMAIKSTQLPAWQVASFRSLVAAATMLLLVRSARRRPDGRTAAVGLTYAATLVLFVLANKLTTSANAIFLQSAAPIYVLLLAPWLLRERVRRGDLGLMAAMAVGLALILSGDDAAGATAPDPRRGNLLAAAAGVTWALTVIGLRGLGRDEEEGGGPSGATAVVAGNLFAGLAGLGFAMPLVAPRPADVGWILFLGVVQIGVAYALLTAAMRAVPALEASLLLLAEPVFNPLWSWWRHGEVPSRPALAGGAVILAATAIKSWLDATPATSAAGEAGLPPAP